LEDILIVDGYNMINSWPELVTLRSESYAHARDKLLEILQDYQGLANVKVIIVYDAHLVKGGMQRQEKIGGVQVIFSGEGETADMIIERLADQLTSKFGVAVATSDWAEQQLVIQRGAARISARELLEKINNYRINSRKYYRENTKIGQTLDARIEAKVRDTLEKWRRKR